MISFCLGSQTSVHAVDFPASSPSPSGTPQWTLQNCEEVIAQKDEDSKDSQILSYCQAAKTAREASDTDAILWKVWTGVASVCTYACAASFAGWLSDPLVCAGVNAAGGITESALHRDLTAAIGAVTSSAGGYLANGLINKALEPESKSPEPAPAASGTSPAEPAPAASGTATTETTTGPDNNKKAPKQKDWAACGMAAMAAINVFMKVQNSAAQDEASKKNLASAGELAMDAKAGAASGGTYTTSTGGARTLGTSSHAPAMKAPAQSVAQSQNGTSDSGSCMSNAQGDSNKVAFCAISSDKTLPSFVKSPRFGGDFKKSSGLNPEELFGKPNKKPTSEELAGIMGGGSLNSAGTSTLAAVLDKVQESLDYDTSGAGYSMGGRGGRSSGGGTAEPNMGDMMAGIMGAFLPKNGKDGGGPMGARSLSFAGRSPAQIFADTKLSLFERVSSRYYSIEEKKAAERGKQ